MLKFPNMEHDEPYMAHVPVGKTGEIIWNFNKAGDFDFPIVTSQTYYRITTKVTGPRNTTSFTQTVVSM